MGRDGLASLDVRARFMHGRTVMNMGVWIAIGIGIGTGIGVAMGSVGAGIALGAGTGAAIGAAAKDFRDED